MRKLLVPVDGSECCRRAAAFAAELVRDTGAQITLVHVYDAPAAAAMGLSFPDDSAAKVAQSSFAHAKQAMADIEVEEHLVEIGHPAERILDVAKENGFTQIIMGSRGRSRFSELVLGSVSERVLRGAPCPVTIVH